MHVKTSNQDKYINNCRIFFFFFFFCHCFYCRSPFNLFGPTSFEFGVSPYTCKNFTLHFQVPYLSSFYSYLSMHLFTSSPLSFCVFSCIVSGFPFLVAFERDFLLEKCGGRASMMLFLWLVLDLFEVSSVKQLHRSI